MGENLLFPLYKHLRDVHPIWRPMKWRRPQRESPVVFCEEPLYYVFITSSPVIMPSSDHSPCPHFGKNRSILFIVLRMHRNLKHDDAVESAARGRLKKTHDRRLLEYCINIYFRCGEGVEHVGGYGGDRRGQDS